MSRSKLELKQTDEDALIEHSKQEPVENDGSNSINEALKSALNSEEITGYILKGKSSAVVNVTDAEKVSNYSLLIANATDYASELSKLLEFGAIQNFILNISQEKILVVGDDLQVGVFMEKTADASKLEEKLLVKTH